MNTSVRARHDARGFSFVELLVTIVIAGIAFAAMVPLFVQAAQVGQGDRARLTAANIAQDKIEKIRQLDWDSIVPGNLNSSTFWVPGAFGDTVVAVGADGTGKTYKVNYTVVDQRDPPDALEVAYKVVTVEVSWSAPPVFVKPVTMKTVIYRQRAGPQMIGLDLQPRVAGSNIPGVGDFSSEQWVTPASGSPIAISAFININDIPFMSSPLGVTPATTGSVEIALNGPGLSLPSQTIETPYDGNASNDEYRYSWDWLAGGAQDGIYSVTATGFSYKGFQGNSLTQTFRIDTGAPPPVTIVTKSGIDGTASFTWSETNGGDLQSYEVKRQELDSGGNPIGSPTSVAGGWGVSPAYTSIGFTQRGLSNGTTYRYSIVAIDQLRQVSDAVYVDITPQPSAVPRPAPPASVVAIPVLDAATVTWTASPSLGVTGFNVYRTDAAGNVSLVGYYAGAVGGSTVPSVLQGYDTTSHYQVTALVPATGFPTAGESDYSPIVTAPFDLFSGVPWARVQTGSRPVYSIRLYNAPNQSRSLRLWYLGRFGLDTPMLVHTWNSVAGKSNTTYVTNQPPGRYKVETKKTSPSTSPWVSGPAGDSPPPTGTTLMGPSGQYTINVP